MQSHRHHHGPSERQRNPAKVPRLGSGRRHSRIRPGLRRRGHPGHESMFLPKPSARSAEKFGPVDMVICGKQTIDGDTAQVGPGIAMRLGLSQLTLVDQIVEVDPEKRVITVRRKLEGRKEIVLAKLPALLTVVREINLPRYPIVNRRLLAELAEIPTWTNEMLKLPDRPDRSQGFSHQREEDFCSRTENREKSSATGKKIPREP